MHEPLRAYSPVTDEIAFRVAFDLCVNGRLDVLAWHAVEYQLKGDFAIRTRYFKTPI